MGRAKKNFESNVLESVLAAVKQYGAAGASRSQVAERTGFNLKTVQAALRRVTETGDVTVTGAKRGVRYVTSTGATVTPAEVVTSTVTEQLVNNQ